MGYAVRNRDNICYPFKKTGWGGVENNPNGVPVEVVLFETIPEIRPELFVFYFFSPFIDILCVVFIRLIATFGCNLTINILHYDL